MPFTYSWRDKTKNGCLGSGLDDYPRDYLINKFKEIHVDLQSWMILLSDFMARFADFVGNQTESYTYREESNQMLKNLHTLSFNTETGLYTDWAGMQWAPKKNEQGQLSEPIEWRDDDMKCGKAYPSLLNLPARCNQPNNGDPNNDNARCCKFYQCVVDNDCDCPGCKLDISIDDDPTVRMFNQFSRHTGIVNFFPLMFGLIDKSDRLQSSLNTL